MLYGERVVLHGDRVVLQISMKARCRSHLDKAEGDVLAGTGV